MAPPIKFGTDGWRGVIADDFTYANVRRVAHGTAEYLLSRSKDPLAVIGYDCRFASEEFARAVRAGAPVPIRNCWAIGRLNFRRR